MPVKQYKVAPMVNLTGAERAQALNVEWSRLERPFRLYGKHSGGTIGFPLDGDIMSVDNTGNRKFWNVHSKIVESDLNELKSLLADDLNTGQWNGYKNAILNGKSGKINGNQVIPNTWSEI